MQEALRRSTLFACLSDEQLARVSRLVKRFEMAPGPIFLEGDRSSNAYVLISGRVDISIFSSDGRELILYKVGPGDFFGEMALLDHQPRSACAIARIRCDLISVSRSALLQAIANSPELALRMIASLSQRLRVADDSIKAMSFLDMSARLARTLLAIEREQDGHGVVHVSQEELAVILGCARQSITRTLATWRRLGYASTARGKVRLLNPRKLRALSQP
jgi:CRP-like cAMP-binding protein